MEQEQEKEQESNSPPPSSVSRSREGTPAGEVVVKWERHKGRPLSPVEVDAIVQTVEEFGAVRVRQALDDAVKAGAKSWRYVEIAAEDNGNPQSKPKPAPPKSCPCGRTLGPRDAKLCWECAAKAADEARAE
jgi:hypothetical protein